MSFTSLQLDENIYKALTHCGYTTATPIQAKAIPDILAGCDLVASAQTGTGKTAAFVIPALQRLSTQKPTKKTKILILTPTRELASQIRKAADDLGKFLRFNIVSLVGGMPYYHQIKDLARGADIIVATPGRLLDHINSKRVDLSNVEMLVLDEADRMLDMGFIDDVKLIASLAPKERQTLLFSATVDKQITSIVRQILKEPKWIDLSDEKISAPKIKQEFYKVSTPMHKMRLLKQLITEGNIFKAIIFSATKINADKLASQLTHDGYPAAPLHGDLRQNVRNRTVEQLSKGKIQFLVATDVAARGIHIDDLTHVINYDVPRFCEDYVHRIGRTGRAGKSGIAISFVLPSDVRHIKNIERFTGQRVQLMTHSGDKNASNGQDFQEDASYSKSASRERSDEYRPFKKRSISRDHTDSNERRGRPARNDAKPNRGFSDSRRDARPSRFARSDDNRSARPSRFAGSDENRSARPSRFAGSDENRSARPSRFAGSDENRSARPSRFAGSDENRSARPSRFAGSDENRSARPSRFAGSDENRSARPSRFAGSDENRSARPSRFAGSDENRSARPSRFAGSDENRSARPSRFAGSDENRSARPSRFAGSDENRSARPSRFAGSDENRSARPSRFAGSDENRSARPSRFAGSDENRSARPSRFAGSDKNRSARPSRFSGSDDNRSARPSRFGTANDSRKSSHAPARPKKQYGVNDGRIQTDSVKEVNYSRGGEQRSFKKRSINKDRWADKK